MSVVYAFSFSVGNLIVPAVAAPYLWYSVVVTRGRDIKQSSPVQLASAIYNILATSNFMSGAQRSNQIEELAGSTGSLNKTRVLFQVSMYDKSHMNTQTLTKLLLVSLSVDRVGRPSCRRIAGVPPSPAASA